MSDQEILSKRENTEKTPLTLKISKNPAQIEKLCNPTGSIDGGEEVTLLVSYNNFSINSIQIRVFEVGPNKETLWQNYAKNIQIYYNAVTFKMPKYGGVWPTEATLAIVCLIQLICITDNVPSTPVEYIYTNDEALTFSRKSHQKQREEFTPMDDLPRPTRNDCNVVLLADSKAPNTQSKDATFVLRKRASRLSRALLQIRTIAIKNACNPKESLQRIARLNEDYAEQQMHGNTIFHDAIACEGYFVKLYKMSKTLHFEILVREVINDRRENLLHYACKLNKSTCIRPLLSFGCSTICQDINGRTPLHIAIKHQNSDCVDKFRELFCNQADYPHLAAEFQQLFEIYNAQGHTALHLAVLNDLRELVDAMLKFCKAVEIDVCAIEVLGSGDTILHLAVSAGLNDMVKLIINRMPNARHCANYAGYNAFGEIIN